MDKENSSLNDRLLTDEDLDELEKEITLGLKGVNPILNRLIEMQAAKTAPIAYQQGYNDAKAECQERIERISKEIDLISNKIAECVSNIRGDWSEPRPDCKEIEQELRKLEALKKREGIDGS